MLFYPGRNLHCSQTGEAAAFIRQCFTQVVIYIALKRANGLEGGINRFTQVVIYIALKPMNRFVLQFSCFTQVVIYIALKQIKNP